MHKEAWIKATVVSKLSPDHLLGRRCIQYDVKGKESSINRDLKTHHLPQHNTYNLNSPCKPTSNTSTEHNPQHGQWQTEWLQAKTLEQKSEFQYWHSLCTQQQRILQDIPINLSGIKHLKWTTCSRKVKMKQVKLSCNHTRLSAASIFCKRKSNTSDV